MAKHSFGIGAFAQAFRASVTMLAAGAVIGCGATADSIESDAPDALEEEDEIGHVSQKMLWGISQALLTEHHHWHTGGRSATNRGIDFLAFHRTFMAKMAAEYRALGLPASELGPWNGVPGELKTVALGWNDALANAELRIISNNPPFASEDEFGRFIEISIHNWIHGAVATKYNEEAFRPIETSPASTFFFRVHGMVDLWWSRWLASEHRHTSASTNISGSRTTLNHPLLNDRPYARLIVTHDRPDFGTTITKHLGVRYDNGRWGIYLEDGSTMPSNANFNVQIEGGILTQTAYSQNTTGNYFSVDHPFNFAAGIPVWGTHVYNPISHTPQTSNRSFGVRYTNARYSFFNEDGANMASGTPYNFLASYPKNATGWFIHTANPGNTFLDTTFIVNSLVDGNPNARLIVTQNWNPTGPSGVNNNHAIGVRYDGSHWGVFNEDFSGISSGASFNVLVQ